MKLENKKYNIALEEAKKSCFLYREMIVERSSNPDTTKTEFSKHFKKWDFLSTKDFKRPNQGELFLYEAVYVRDNKDVVTYPKIGIYLHEMICDQTLQIEWVDYRRTIECRKKFNYDFDVSGKIYNSTSDLSDCPTEVRSMILWDDSMLTYGVWKTMPSWRELRREYENTWWYHKTKEQKRDNRINSII